MDPVELLLAEVTAGGGKWPLKREDRVAAHVRAMRAFLEADRERLRIVHEWPQDRTYRLDPLPGLIADAWADHLFGEDPTIVPASEDDAGALAFMLEGNTDLVGDLHAAERTVAGEGEHWWRIYRDDELGDVPLLEWHNRDEVIPYYVGRRLVAVALVTVLEENRPRDRAVYRHLEIHVDGLVEHALFRGTKGKLGQRVALEDHPETEELAGAVGESEQWAHGLPMLMGKVSNGRKRIKRLGNLGISDFYYVQDQLLDLNEAASIGAENARLTAKKRAVIPEESLKGQPVDSAYTGPLVDNGDGSFVRPDGRANFDAGEDVLVISALDRELGQSADGAFKVLEYSFDAEALIAWKHDLEETALTRIGLTPSYVGVDTRSSYGQAMSGTARRLLLTPTTNAGRGKGRPWDDELPRILSLMARVDSLPVEAGGFGRTWQDPTTMPSVERADALPSDEVEEAQVETSLVSAGLRSRETSIRRQHPDWSDEQVDEELEAIKRDRPAPSSGLGNSLLG